MSPIVRIDIHVPSDYVGNVMKLCEEKRGIQKNMGYLAQNRVVITYELPFAEIVFDFFDRLKSAHARLRLDGLRSDRLPGLEPRAVWTSF